MNTEQTSESIFSNMLNVTVLNKSSVHQEMTDFENHLQQMIKSIEFRQISKFSRKT